MSDNGGVDTEDKLAESLLDLFSNISIMVQGELQGSTNQLELLEKMNTRVAEEYGGFGDVASGLRSYVEQLNKKKGSFEDYVKQIDAIDQQVTEFEAVISMLDKHVSLLESKILFRVIGESIGFGESSEGSIPSSRGDSRRSSTYS